MKQEQVNGPVSIPEVIQGSAEIPEEPVRKPKHYYLSRKEQEFFLNNQKAVEGMQAGLQGALLFLAQTHEMFGKVRLSLDASELVEEG